MVNDPLAQVADKVVATTGLVKTLVVGRGSVEIVCCLLELAADAYACPPPSELDARQTGEGRLLPARLVRAVNGKLPVADDSFDAAVILVSDSHVESNVELLAEAVRVARRDVFLHVVNAGPVSHRGVGSRWFWETRCFDLGLRKHARYYDVNDFTLIDDVATVFSSPFEKTPAAARVRFPLAVLQEERDLHMDMLRDSGERSDAHVIRYHWASQFLRPGDRVLDAACGLGYGAWVVRQSSECAEVVGIDNSQFAIAYAQSHYGAEDEALSFQCGDLPAALSTFDSGSFDSIVSFETLEHIDDPEHLIAEFHRLLVPGGRLLVSVPNDWSDETGKDPSPYHQHVYSWSKLRQQFQPWFLEEALYGLTATQAKAGSPKPRWVRRPRLLTSLSRDALHSAESEWCLLVGMKHPSAKGGTYVERVFANTDPFSKVETANSYVNPWLRHAIVTHNCRLQDNDALAKLAVESADAAPPDSIDRCAAECVLAHRIRDDSSASADQVVQSMVRIDAALRDLPAGSAGMRWMASLLFVKAQLYQKIGDLAQAAKAFETCGEIDFRPCGPHIATKICESWYSAGRIALATGNAQLAATQWRRGLAVAKSLLDFQLQDVVLNEAHPARFHHGDGIREYCLAWDFIARCANGLNLLATSEIRKNLSVRKLDLSFQFEIDTARRDAAQAMQPLAERTNRLAIAGLDLLARTSELEGTRRALTERTAELVAVRGTLEERTTLLERTNELLRERTAVMTSIANELKTRTAELESTHVALVRRTDDLVATRTLLAERTAMLEQVNALVQERTDALGTAARDLASRTHELESTRACLIERTQLLDEAHVLGRERTDALHEAANGLQARASELETTRVALTECTNDLIATRALLAERTRLLEQANTLVLERTDALETAARDLVDRTLELESTRACLVERTRLLERNGSAFDTSATTHPGTAVQPVSLDVEHKPVATLQDSRAPASSSVPVAARNPTGPDLGALGNMREALVEVWNTVRQLRRWIELGRMDVRIRYRRTTLGPLWMTASTAVLILSVGLTYGALFGNSIEQYLPHFLVGFVLWQFVSQTLSESCRALIQSQGLIKGLPAPPSIHLMRMFARQIMVHLHNLVLIAIGWIVFQWQVSWQTFLLVPGVLLVLVALLGCIFLLGPLSARFRDTQQALEAALQPLFLLTPIVWVPAALNEQVGMLVLYCNPLFYLLEVVRSPILGHAPSIQIWIGATLVSLSSLLLGLSFYSRYHRRIAVWL